MYLGSSIIADGDFAKRDSKLLNPQEQAIASISAFLAVSISTSLSPKKIASPALQPSF